MSVVNGKRAGRLVRHRGRRRAGGAASGPFAGVVFNRPLDQVFTYRVPARLRETVRPGQRVRVPLGRGNKPAVGYCVRVDDASAGGRRAGAGQGRARGARRPAADRRGDARADPLDGRLLRLLVGPGARRRGAGRGEEAGGDAGRDVPDRPRGGPRRRYEHARSCRPSRPRRWRSSAGRTSRSRSPTSAGWPSAPPGRSPPSRQRGHRPHRQAPAATGAALTTSPTAAEAERARGPARPDAPSSEAVLDRLAPRPGRRRLRHVPDPRRDRQRQDRGLPRAPSSRSWRGAARRSCWCPRSA